MEEFNSPFEFLMQFWLFGFGSAAVLHYMVLPIGIGFRLFKSFL